MDTTVGASEVTHYVTLYGVFDKMCCVPECPIIAPRRLPISIIYKTISISDVITRCVEQGVVMPDGEAVYMPMLTGFNPGDDKVFIVEMRQTRTNFASLGTAW